MIFPITVPNNVLQNSKDTVPSFPTLFLLYSNLSLCTNANTYVYVKRVTCLLLIRLLQLHTIDL